MSNQTQMDNIEEFLSGVVYNFLKSTLRKHNQFSDINSQIKRVSGINNFLRNQEDADYLSIKIDRTSEQISEVAHREYGDYQTNVNLTSSILRKVSSDGLQYEFLLEPTCGKGNFILSALQEIHTIKKIIGVEIYLPYIWKTKFRILDYYLKNEIHDLPDIDIIHTDVFTFPFSEISQKTKTMCTLVIGNPPWVTNSELGAINSINLPQKSNLKNHKGLDAITGKGNFDLGEYITLLMLKSFHKHAGSFVFLLKNSVVKNIIHDQVANRFMMSKLKKLNIDAKKEFNVSVDACLFITELGIVPEDKCSEYDFYTLERIRPFGWENRNFVSSVEDYRNSFIVDGTSPFTWRSGVKHDVAKIMEFDRDGNGYKNKLGNKFEIENDLVYGLLKSSDLKTLSSGKPRKYTIITQRKIGASTDYIQNQFPLTASYLLSNRDHFLSRKSSIYRGKPDYSIFGIGEYSFARFKIAISGMYKTTHFTLVPPYEGKVQMLDDTCYFIGFDQKVLAEIAHYLLNSELVQSMLKSIIFSDSKRPITKDVLMRIDLKYAYMESDYNEAKTHIPSLSKNDWDCFREALEKTKTGQLAFA